MKIPIIEEKSNKTYIISGYIDAIEASEEQISLREKSLIKNLDLEYFRKLETEHKKSFPKLTDTEWQKVFPEAIDSYIVPKIAELENMRDRLEEKTRRWLKIIRNKVKQDDWWFWEMKLEFFEVKDLLDAEKQINHLKYLIKSAEVSEHQNNESFQPTNMITQNMIMEAERKPLENIVEPITKLKRTGKNLVGLCPFYSEKTPSFYIYTDTNSFYCFGCQKGGNIINFVREYYGLSFKEAIKFLT